MDVKLMSSKQYMDEMVVPTLLKALSVVNQKVRKRGKEREREGERKRERDKDTNRETDRQINRHTKREREQHYLFRCFLFVRVILGIHQIGFLEVNLF
jgi:hypothetical protein